MLRVFTIISALIIISQAGVFEYDNFILPPWNYDWSRFGMFSLDETPTGDMMPFVRLNFTLRVENPSNSKQKGVLFMFLFPSRERYFADYVLNQLSKARKAKKDCLSIMDKINFSTTQAISYLQYPIDSPSGNTLFAAIDKVFDIKESGLWYLYMFHCGALDSTLASDSETVIINGYSEWKNPYGYLDGKNYPLLILSVVLIVAYFLTAAVWVFLCVYYKKDLLDLHKCGIFILLIGIFESIALFCVNYYSNIFGNLILSLPIILALISMFKQTLVRALSLLVTLGYSIARVYLSKGTYIFLFGICLGYFISGLAYKIVEIVPDLRSMGPLTTEIIQFPGIMFSLVYFGWVFVSAHNTMILLREFKEMEKVEKFHVFSRVLGVCLVLSSLFTLCKGAALLLQYDDTWWRVWWMWDAFWYLMFYIVTVACLVIWRPLPNNTFYHISPEMLQAQVIQVENEENPEENNQNLNEEDQNDDNQNSHESSEELDHSDNETELSPLTNINDEGTLNHDRKSDDL